MAEPVPHRASLLQHRLAKPLAIAFGIGLLLFLMLWIDQRNDTDFFKATGPVAGSDEGDALPAPLPADIAGENGNASGLRLPPPDPGSALPPGEEPPRIIEPPAPIAPPPPPASPPSAPSAPSMADSSVPMPIHRVPPRYPREALRSNAGGVVRVKVTVAPDGGVERMDLAESSGNRYLDRAALEAVRRWRFNPAVRNGQPVSATVIVPLEFTPSR